VTCDRLVVFSRYSTTKTDRRDITEILLTVALSTKIRNHLVLVAYFSHNFSNLSNLTTWFWQVYC